MLGDRMKKRLDRLLDEAEEAADREDWAKAGQLARQALLIDAGNSDASDFLRLAELGIAQAGAAVSEPPGAEAPSARAARESTQRPTSFANGRYQVKEFLGEGGKKRVYKAHDSVLDRDVALAVIKTEGLDPTSRVRITREAQAMGRLGDHPNVLSIHDLGDEGGQPYMVLPLMPGGDVGTLLEKAEDHRLPLEQAIDLATQICRGLEFAHSKSIVHRDLKPGNIWLTSDGTAKIGDFGLAVAIDRSRLTQEGMMVGTVSYMPPEQAMGGDVTPQSDLYSLGAMLYEMVCGRPPFLGDDSVAIIGQHINTPPVAPTWHNSECPRALEALILRLLTKDPSERPESAADVLTALEGIDLTVSAEEAAPERDEAHALDSLAGGVFVGRQREMGELKAALEDALSGRGRLVMLVGEPGIGKTRTAQELATYAGLRGCQVLWGRCHENRGAPPYWPWVQAIRSYVRERDPERLRSEMGTGAADIAEIVSDVRERLPDLKPSPAVDDPEQARFRLFDSITAFLKSASRGQPLVVILDNLHWADKPSLMLLEFLAQEFADSRLLVIGTYRDVDLSRQHPLAETLGELTRERLFQRVLLRGLSQEDVGRFIEMTSGISPPRGLVRAIHSQTEGNPLFVTETVRLMVQEGELLKEGDREHDSWEVRIPEGVREVIGRRLNRLSARCNETLTIASVVGREFGLDQLRLLVTDATDERLLETLDEALSSKVIEELPQTVGRYEFTHALIRQTLYDELTTTRRVRLHARIIEVLEGLYEEDVGQYAVELAYHAAEAETVSGPEKIILYSALAGQRALTTHAHEEAVVHFQRALAAKEEQPMDEETADLLFGLGSALAATIDRDRAQEAWDVLAQAFHYYADSGHSSKAIAVVGLPVGILGYISGTVSIVGRALEMAPAESIDSARLLARYGYSLYLERGDYESAMEALGRAIAIAQREGDRALEARALAYSAITNSFQYRFDDCLKNSLRAIDLMQDSPDMQAEVRARHAASLASMFLGEPVTASTHATVASELAERLRDHTWTYNTVSQRAVQARLLGDWQAVREFAYMALQVRPSGNRALAVMALMLEDLGQVEERDSYVQRLVSSTQTGVMDSNTTPAALALIGRTSGSVDLLEQARKASELFTSSAKFSDVIKSSALAVIAVVQKDSRAAAEQYAVLKLVKGTFDWLGLGMDRLLGLLAQTMSHLDDATTHFEDALAFYRRIGYRPELAWACCDYADMLLERDEEGDRRKVAPLLDESLAISSELGMRPLMERVLSRKMSLQGIDISSPQTSIDAVVSAVEVERPNLQPHAAPDGTVTVMFTDIEGSTAMTERLGDLRAQEVLRVHNAIIREQVGANEGFEVKSQGDGFMLAFSSARTALECAIAIQQTLVDHNAENPGEPIRVRMGLHTGEAIKEGEDFFGKTVILAARIASQAVGGQILVSSLLKALVESSGEFEFGEGRDVQLKGLSGAHQVYDVRWADRS